MFYWRRAAVGKKKGRELSRLIVYFPYGGNSFYKIHTQECLHIQQAQAWITRVTALTPRDSGTNSHPEISAACRAWFPK